MSIEREVGEIKVMVSNIEGLLKAQNGRIAKVEGEVSGLRRWQAFVIGGCVTAGTGIGAVITKFLG